MDAVRAAVGDDKLTYLGYSYGTLLGAIYAQLYPQRVRALVLDGAVDPQQRLVAGSESQAEGFERAFDNFARWCAANAGRCPIAPDARAAVTVGASTRPRSPRYAATTGGRPPPAGSSTRSSRRSTPSPAGRSWPGRSTGWPRATRRTCSSSPTRTPGGRTTATTPTCSTPTSRSTAPTRRRSRAVEQIRQLQSQWRTKYPLFGPALAVGMLSCVEWPGGRDPYPTGAAERRPADRGGRHHRRPGHAVRADRPSWPTMLGVGRVLTWEGEGHTAYPQTSCVTARGRRLPDRPDRAPGGPALPGEIAGVPGSPA